jgi:hypothetical protein
MYPLDMFCAAAGGFAVANDEAEHKALTAHGYGPAFVEAEAEKQGEDNAEGEADELRAKLEAAGIKFDKRWGVAKLQAALDA